MPKADLPTPSLQEIRDNLVAILADMADNHPAYHALQDEVEDIEKILSQRNT